MNAALLDIIVLGIFVIFLFFGFKNGIIKSILVLVNLIISSIVSVFFSHLCSVFIYNKIVKKFIVNQIENLVKSNKIFSTGDLLKKIPKVIRKIILNYGITPLKISHIINKVDKNYLPERIAELFKPGIIRAIEPVLCVIIFILCIILGKFLVKISLKLFRPNLLKTVGGVLGGVLGIFKAYIIISVLIFCLKVSMPVMNLNSSELLSTNTINSTVIFKYMYKNNIIYKII